jgi:hypothetical protein
MSREAKSQDCVCVCVSRGAVHGVTSLDDNSNNYSSMSDIKRPLDRQISLTETN